MAKSVRCKRCRKGEGKHGWTVDPCAARSIIQAKLCDECDIALNEYILRFFRVRDKTKLVEAYRKKVLES